MRNLSHLTIGPQGLVFNPATGHSFVLNDSGVTVLKSLQTGSDSAEVIRQMSEKYALAWNDAERDVTDFMGRLRKLGLL